MKEEVIDIDIKIIGSKCSNGIKLKRNVLKAIENINKKFKIEESDKLNEKGITNIPALIIDGKVVSSGKVLSEREVKKLLV